MEYVEKKQRPVRRTGTRANPVAPVDVDEPVAEEEPSTSGNEAELPEQPSPRRSRPRPSLLTILGASVAMLALAALILSVVEWTGSNSRYNSTQALRKSAMQAASTYGVYLSSYDYKDLNGPTAPWAEVDQHSTPSFRKDFDATKTNLTSLVNDYKATATGKVIATGLSSVSSTRAVALLFIDQTVTNTAQKPGTTTQPLRVELVMQRQHGKWLIDRLEVPS